MVERRNKTESSRKANRSSVQNSATQSPSVSYSHGRVFFLRYSRYPHCYYNQNDQKVPVVPSNESNGYHKSDNNGQLQKTPGTKLQFLVSVLVSRLAVASLRIWKFLPDLPHSCETWSSVKILKKKKIKSCLVKVETAKFLKYFHDFVSHSFIHHQNWLRSRMICQTGLQLLRLLQSFSEFRLSLQTECTDAEDFK